MARTGTTAPVLDRARLADAWVTERAAASAARNRTGHGAEWNHLERAHILSQPMAVPHVRTHLAMLAFAIRHHDRYEILGQLFRLTVAAAGSWTGRYPLGNTGGTDIRAFEPMPVPADLRQLLGG